MDSVETGTWVLSLDFRCAPMGSQTAIRWLERAEVSPSWMDLGKKADSLGNEEGVGRYARCLALS